MVRHKQDLHNHTCCTCEKLHRTAKVQSAGHCTQCTGQAQCLPCTEAPMAAEAMPDPPLLGRSSLTHNLQTRHAALLYSSPTCKLPPPLCLLQALSSWGGCASPGALPGRRFPAVEADSSVAGPGSQPHRGCAAALQRQDAAAGAQPLPCCLRVRDKVAADMYLGQTCMSCHPWCPKLL